MLGRVSHHASASGFTPTPPANPATAGFAEMVGDESHHAFFLAERVRFELTIPLQERQFSKLLH